MFTKSDLTSFIQANCQNARITKFEFGSAEKFTLELKCEVEKDQNVKVYDQLTRDWIRNFAKFSATTWIVRSCFSKLKRLVFRKIYVCHRSSFNKKKKANNETRNQECKAKVDFRIKFINRNTIKNDRFLKEGLNLTISIDFIHSHKVRTREAFKLLRNTSETDEFFGKYFETGCSTTAAKAYHELTLLDKYGENCPEAFANATINPTIRHITYIHGKLKKGKQMAPSFKDIMEQKRNELKTLDIELEYLIENEVAVIITPLMKRVAVEFGLQYFLIDTTEILHGPMVTFVLVPTKIGALPVACAIHRKVNDFCELFNFIKSHIEKTVTVFPDIVMFSDMDIQDIASPCGKITSGYSFGCTTWRWLNDDENKVNCKKRQDLMYSLMKLIYSKNYDDAEDMYLNLLRNEDVKSNAKLKEYLEELWEYIVLYIIKDDNTLLKNSLVELSIRLLKEFLLRKCKSFTVSLMIDTVTNILENHFRKIIMSYVTNTKSIAMYTKFLQKNKLVLAFGSEVRRISTNEFRLETQAKPRKYLYFRTDTMCCNCIRSKKGLFCEHLVAIINVIEFDKFKAPTLSEDEKAVFSQLSGEVIKDIKLEVSEDVSNFEECDETEEIEEKDTTNDMDNIETQSNASSSKSDYLFLEVKSEKPDRCDPLDENPVDQLEFLVSTNNGASTSKDDMTNKYETALKALNDEFRRLNRFFSENPNTSNLATMTRLARELGKIRPVEKINLSNLALKTNENRKRKINE